MTWAISFTTDFLNTFLNLPKRVRNKFPEIYKILEENPVNRYSVKLKGYRRLRRAYITKRYRLLYKYGDGWVKLLQILPRNKSTYQNDRLERLAEAEIPSFLPPEFDDEELQSTTEQGNSIVSPEQLKHWLIPEEYWERLLSIQHEDELLDVEIPNVYLCRIIDNLYPSSPEEIENKPEFELNDPEDLTRFASGEVIEFLLKLTNEQKHLLDYESDAPILVKGGPGTGKSTLALYRVAKLVKSGTKNILFTTHTEALINSSKQLLQTLLGQPPEELTVEVKAVDSLAMQHYIEEYGQPNLATEAACLFCLESAIYSTNLTPSERKSILNLGYPYLLEEFSIVIEARSINRLRQYSQIARYGRRYSLKRTMREAIWAVYEKWKDLLQSVGLITIEQVRIKALEIVLGLEEKPYRAVVIDEAQDLSPVALKFLVNLVSSPKEVYLTADVQQSLYQRSFSWNHIQASINFTGETKILRRSFRNTQQIGQACPEILKIMEVDEFSRLQGNKPKIILTDDLVLQAQEIKKFFEEASKKFKLPFCSGVILVPNQEYGEFIAQQLSYNFDFEAKYTHSIILSVTENYLKVLNLYDSKGLEFPFVAVLGLKEGMFPQLPNNIPQDDKEELLSQQRRLFYVGCSRAMKALLVCGSQAHPSRFLDRLINNDYWQVGALK